MKKVSIIVPVYNAGKTINRCIESLLAQTYNNIEILLINDGSTDDSEKICRAFEKKYPHVSLITQKNSGPATARNTGINHASGDYISFVDADDYVEKNFISTMIEAAEKEDADMVICGYFEENGKERKKHSFKYKAGSYEGEAAKEIAVSLLCDVSKDRIPPYSWIRMTKTRIFNSPKIRYADGMVRSEDYFLYIQLHFKIQKVYLLSNTPLYHYIENDKSITHVYVKNYWDTVTKIYNELKNKLPMEKNIQNNLDIMIIQRSMIALNNSSRAAEKKTFKSEVYKTLKDKNLKNAIRNLSLKKGFTQFGFYYLMMRMNLYKLIYFRYLAKRKK